MDSRERANQNYAFIIQEYPLLGASEERTLIRKMRQIKGSTPEKRQAARDKLSNSNIRLVLKLAHSYSNNSKAPFEDIMSAGFEGLCIAIDRFRPQKYKTKFSTYAIPWIKLKIFRFLKSFGMAVHVPTHVVDNSHRYRKIINGVDRELSDKELMSELNVTKGTLRNIRRSQMSVLSLDQEVFRGDQKRGTTLGSLLPDTRAVKPNENLVKEERKEVIRETLAELDPVERNILESRYLKFQKINLNDLGKKHGITGERVRQIEVDALQKLKKKLKRRSSFGDF